SQRNRSPSILGMLVSDGITISSPYAFKPSRQRSRLLHRSPRWPQHDLRCTSKSPAAQSMRTTPAARLQLVASHVLVVETLSVPQPTILGHLKNSSASRLAGAFVREASLDFVSHTTTGLP